MRCFVLYIEVITRLNISPDIVFRETGEVACMIGCHERLLVADEKPQPKRHLPSVIEQSGAMWSSSMTLALDSSRVQPNSDD